jgi:hypothetical protein
MTTPQRLAIGFLCGVLAVLVFHQGMIFLLRETGALLTGAATTLVGFFIVATIRGTPIAGGWQLMAWVRGLSIGLSFGLGLWLFHSAITARFFLPPLPRR